MRSLPSSRAGARSLEGSGARCLLLPALACVLVLSGIALPAHAWTLAAAGDRWHLLEIHEEAGRLVWTEQPETGPSAGAGEILPLEDGSCLVAHAGGLDRIGRGSAQSSTNFRMRGRVFDGVERSSDGTLYLLEHPPGGPDSGVPHALVRRDAGSGTLDTLALASPAAYDVHLAAGDSVFWIPRLSGRTLDRVRRSREGGWITEEVRIASGSGEGGPRDDAFWLLRLVFPLEDGNVWLLEQARGDAPRLRLLASDGTSRDVHRFSFPFQARNGALAESTRWLVLNAGRAFFTYTPETGEGTMLRLPANASAVAVPPEGDILAVAMEGGAHKSTLRLYRSGSESVLSEHEITDEIRVLAFLRAAR